MVEDIKRNKKVGLSLQSNHDPKGAPGIFISLEGDAEIVRDKARFEEHWTKDLDRWFEDGLETEGVVMHHLHATRSAYRDGADEADFDI